MKEPWSGSGDVKRPQGVVVRDSSYSTWTNGCAGGAIIGAHRIGVDALRSGDRDTAGDAWPPARRARIARRDLVVGACCGGCRRWLLARGYLGRGMAAGLAPGLVRAAGPAAGVRQAPAEVAWSMRGGPRAPAMWGRLDGLAGSYPPSNMGLVWHFKN